MSSEYLLTLLIISSCAQVVLRTCCNLHSLAKIFCMIYCTCDNMSGKLWRTHCPMWACYQSSYYSDAIWVICEFVADFIPKSAWTRTRLWFVGVQGWIQKRCVGRHGVVTTSDLQTEKVFIVTWVVLDPHNPNYVLLALSPVIYT